MNLENLEAIIEEGEDGDNNVQLTSAELIAMMEEIWVNEKFAPEILPHKSDIVDCVLGQITYMEQNVSTLPSANLKKGIHQLEVDRIRFLTTSYLRHRLEKIETYVFHILKQEELRREQGIDPYLSDTETEFAQKFKEALEEHLEDVTNFHPAVPVKEWRTHLVQPNMRTFVFVKAKNFVEGVVVDVEREDTGSIDVDAGAQLLISYSGVQDLVKKGDLNLI